MAPENYWKEKYADVHLRLTNKIAELEKENTELKEALKTLAEGLNKRQMTLQEIKEFCKKEIEYFDNNDNYGQQADWIALLQKITKAEEE